MHNTAALNALSSFLVAFLQGLRIPLLLNTCFFFFFLKTTVLKLMLVYFLPFFMSVLVLDRLENKTIWIQYYDRLKVSYLYCNHFCNNLGRHLAKSTPESGTSSAVFSVPHVLLYALTPSLFGLLFLPLELDISWKPKFMYLCFPAQFRESVCVCVCV